MVRSEHIGLAAYAACARLDNPRANLYADLIQLSLDQVARVALEAIMEKHQYTYQSEFARKHYADGRQDGLGEGREKGLEEGIEKGYRALVRRQLQKRFGELPADANDKLEQADADTLVAWAERVLTASSLAEVFAPA